MSFKISKRHLRFRTKDVFNHPSFAQAKENMKSVAKPNISEVAERINPQPQPDETVIVLYNGATYHAYLGNPSLSPQKFDIKYDNRNALNLVPQGSRDLGK